jgi:uncharacterized protein (DUF433 family)
MFRETTIQSPLTEDKNGVIRIGQTRVTLLSVINAYNQGASPEEIVQDFPTVSLSEAYSTIAYYLQYRSEIDEYLNGEREHAQQMRSENSVAGIRERLEARLPKPAAKQ